MAIENFNEFMSEERKVSDFTIDGKCSNCGNCCNALLPISDKEIKIIKNYVNSKKIKPVVINHPIAHLIDLTCPFRDDLNKKCLIYEVRPLVCKQFICNKPNEYSKLYIEAIKGTKYNLTNMQDLFGGYK